MAELKWDIRTLEYVIVELRRIGRDDTLRHASQEFIDKLPSLSSGPCAGSLKRYESHISTISDSLYEITTAMEKWLGEQLQAVRSMDKEHIAVFRRGDWQRREEG